MECILSTTPLAWWDIRHIRRLLSGNVGLERIVSGLVDSLLPLARLELDWARRCSVHDKLHRLWEARCFEEAGIDSRREAKPAGTLICIGRTGPDPVARRNPEDSGCRNRNRGMYWDAELVLIVAGPIVSSRVTKLIDDKDGEHAGNEESCVVWIGRVRARYSPCRMLCPRRCILYWRRSGWRGWSRQRRCLGADVSVEMTPASVHQQ